VLYTDVDGQCDKLVTDDRHPFITLTVHVNWQHLRRSTWQLYLQPFEIWLVTVNLPTKFEVFLSAHYEDMKGDTKCRKLGGLGN